MNTTDETPAVYRPKKKVNHESRLQQTCVKWFRLQYPQYLLYANANGGKRSPHEAAIMNGEGVVSGVPDLFLAQKRGEWGGLYIEMKILPNKPTLTQLLTMEQLFKAGYSCQVCYSLDYFIFIVNEYLALPKPAYQSNTGILLS